MPEKRTFVVRFDGRVPPRIGEMLELEITPWESTRSIPQTGDRIG